MKDIMNKIARIYNILLILFADFGLWAYAYFFRNFNSLVPKYIILGFMIGLVGYTTLSIFIIIDFIKNKNTILK